MSNRGFTLIEIVISIGIFIVGFVSVMSLFTGGVKTQNQAGLRLTAGLVAENLFASLKEPEMDGLKDDMSGSTVFISTPAESTYYPGFWYYYTLEPFDSGATVSPGDEQRLFVTLCVIEQKFKKQFESFYDKDYTELSSEEKGLYNEHCVKFYTILDKEEE